MKLKAKPCNCAEYRRIESACRDLMAENTKLTTNLENIRKLDNKAFANWQKQRGQLEDKIDILKAERDEWKRRAELMRKWLRNDFNNYNTRWDALVDEFPEAAEWFEENGDDRSG